MSHLGFDMKIMFDYILTEKGGSCTVQELADGLGIDPRPIRDFVIKNGSNFARIKHVKAAFPDKVSFKLTSAII